MLYADTIRVFKRVAGTLMELVLGLTGEDCRLFFERAPLCQKLESRSSFAE